MLNINGYKYEVLEKKEVNYSAGNAKYKLVLAKPNGNRVYLAYQYATGAFSTPISMKAFKMTRQNYK